MINNSKVLVGCLREGFLTLMDYNLLSGVIIFRVCFEMNIIQKSNEFGVSSVTDMQRAVKLEADKELRRSATKDERNW